MSGTAHVYLLILSQDGFYWRGLWAVASHIMRWHLLPFWLPRSLSAHAVWEVSLTSRMNYIWSFISYLGSTQPPSSFCFYEPSFHGKNFSPLGNPFVQTGLNLPPLCVCTYIEPLCPSTRPYHLSLDFSWEIVHLAFLSTKPGLSSEL